MPQLHILPHTTCEWLDLFVPRFGRGECSIPIAIMTIRNHGLTALVGLAVLATVAYASTGDRNPTFQQCLKGCRITYCDPSQPPIPAYLRAFGWTCEDNCRYECGHAFTDMIRTGSRYHQCESSPSAFLLLVLPLMLQSMVNGRSTA